jgi:Arginase family
LHLDVDVISGDELGAVNVPASGGLSYAQVRDSLKKFVAHKNLLGLDIAQFNPDKDPDGSAAKKIVDLLVEALTARLEAADSPEASAAEPAAAPAPVHRGAEPEPTPAEPEPALVDSESSLAESEPTPSHDDLHESAAPAPFGEEDPASSEPTESLEPHDSASTESN